MEWRKAVVKGPHTIEFPKNWVDLHYYEAFNILFRVENALRIFVYSVLKNEFREKWDQLDITSDDSEKGNIASIAKKRFSQAKNFGYLGYSIKCPIMYLTSGELIGLILSDSYWKYFNSYFLGSKDIIKNKLNEINTIRNSFAHFRPIKQDDIEVIKQNAKHVLVSIEKCLFQLINIFITIPTNTAEDWYKHLKTLGTDLCTLKFSQCNDGQWIKIMIKYQCPILRKDEPFENETSYHAPNLLSSAILKKYPELTNHVTYLSELIPYIPYTEGEDPDISKRISLVFSRKILTENYEIIKSNIENLLSKISEETELIKEDNLARGEILEVAVAYVSLREGLESGSESYWWTDLGRFECVVREDDPPEYWGTIFYILRGGFVADMSKYPWMPGKISF